MERDRRPCGGGGVEGGRLAADDAVGRVPAALEVDQGEVCDRAVALYRA